MFRCGRVYLDGEEIDPFALLDLPEPCLMEIVGGDFRVEQLTGAADVKEQGE